LAAATAVAGFAIAADAADAVRPARAFWWETRALEFDEKKWRQHFRVSKNVFNYVLDQIVSHDVFRVAKNITHAVPVEKQLAVFLYRVGKVHPGVAAIAEKFEMSSGTVVACTERVARAVIERLSHVVNLPKDGEEKKKMMKGFERRGYKGGVVTIDCTGIRIVAPVGAGVGGRAARRVVGAPEALDERGEVEEGVVLGGRPRHAGAARLRGVGRGGEGRESRAQLSRGWRITQLGRAAAAPRALETCRTLRSEPFTA